MSGLYVAFNLYNMYQDQYSQVDKLWNYFGIVSLAVAGFTLGNEKATKSITEPIVIILGYLAFCVGNYLALIKGHEFMQSLGAKYNEAALLTDNPLVNFHNSSDVTLYYLLVVSTFCLSIIIVSYNRLKDIAPE